MKTRDRAPPYRDPVLHSHAPRLVALRGGDRNEEIPATENEKCCPGGPRHRGVVPHGGQGQGGLKTRPCGQRICRAPHFKFPSVFPTMGPLTRKLVIQDHRSSLKTPAHRGSPWVPGFRFHYFAAHRRLCGAGGGMRSSNSTNFSDREAVLKWAASSFQ
jgi:hypothetical protein